MKLCSFSHFSERLRGAVWTLLAIVSLSVPVWAGSSPATPAAVWLKSSSAQFPDPKISWVDWRGQKITPKWRTRSRWFFDTAAEESPVGHPVLRTWVELPASHQAISLKGGTSFKSKIDPEDQPFGELGKRKGSVLRFDLDTRLSSATLEFLDAKGKLQDVGFWVELEYDEPVFWLDRSCWQNEVSVKKEKLQSKFLYAGVVCEDAGDAMKMVFLFSPDAQWRGSSWGSHPESRPEARHSGPGWVEYSVEKSSKHFEGVQALGSFSIANKGDKPSEVSEYQVLYRVKKRNSLWSFNVNLGPTALIYAEAATKTSGAIDVSELGLTLKAGAGFKVIPKKIEVSASGYFTLFPILVSPSTLPSARYFGANGRLGYLFNSSPQSPEWSFWSGWYVWGMLVSAGNPYGVKFLSGPQIFVQIKDSRPGGRFKLAYLKLAPIASGARLPSLADREVALGGSLQFNSPESRFPLLATLDVAHTAIGASMHLLSVSGGVQVNW